MVVFLGWQLLGVIPLFMVAFNQSNDLVQLMASSQNAFADLGIDSNLYLFAILVMFVLGLLSLLFSVKRIHLRSITSLITSRQQIDWHRIFYGFGFWFLLSLVFLAIDYEYHLNLTLKYEIYNKVNEITEKYNKKNDLLFKRKF